MPWNAHCATPSEPARCGPACASVVAHAGGAARCVAWGDQRRLCAAHRAGLPQIGSRRHRWSPRCGARLRLWRHGPRPARSASTSARAYRRGALSGPGLGAGAGGGLPRCAGIALSYGSPRGELELREALADHLGRTRGVAADPACIVVLSGIAQGAHLLAHALADFWASAGSRWRTPAGTPRRSASGWGPGGRGPAAGRQRSPGRGAGGGGGPGRPCPSVPHRFRPHRSASAGAPGLGPRARRPRDRGRLRR